MAVYLLLCTAAQSIYHSFTKKRNLKRYAVVFFSSHLLLCLNMNMLLFFELIVFVLQFPNFNSRLISLFAFVLIRIFFKKYFHHIIPIRYHLKKSWLLKWNSWWRVKELNKYVIEKVQSPKIRAHLRDTVEARTAKFMDLTHCLIWNDSHDTNIYDVIRYQWNSSGVSMYKWTIRWNHIFYLRMK